MYTFFQIRTARLLITPNFHQFPSSKNNAMYIIMPIYFRMELFMNIWIPNLIGQIVSVSAFKHKTKHTESHICINIWNYLIS